MNESDTQPLAAVAVAKSGSAYSAPFVGGRDAGFLSGEFDSTGGAVTITLQACLTDSSVDADWYTPEDSQGNVLGAVTVMAAPGKKFVQFPAVLAPWLRFKYVEGGTNDSVVTSKLIRKY